MSHLTLNSISKSFGHTQALTEASIALLPGEVHVLIGANGSGKSTLCKIIAGAVQPTSGEVLLDGVPISIDSPADAKALGVSIFYQELSLAENRTVAENISLGDLPAGAGFLDRTEILLRAEAMVAPFQAVVGEGFDLDAPVHRLRPDQKQLVEIMKTLQMDGSIYIFDEPTSALDRAQSDVFFEQLQRKKDEGKVVILISHRMDEILEYGDRATVLRDGETVFSAAVADTDKDEIVARMIGQDGFEDAFTQVPPERAATQTFVSVTTEKSNALGALTLELQKGEILGLGGLHGQGQSRLLRGMLGAGGVTCEVKIDGVSIPLSSPKSAIQGGIGYVSGDRTNDGSLTDRPIFENTVPVHVLRSAKRWINRGRMGRSAYQALELLSTKYAGLGASIGSLSGGNQQKVLISRWLIDKPQVLLLDDPTKGIDIATKVELFALVRELAKEGMSIILYSSEEAELLANSDRILVFNNGMITRELTGAERNKASLAHASFEAA